MLGGLARVALQRPPNQFLDGTRTLGFYHLPVSFIGIRPDYLGLKLSDGIAVY